MSEPEPNSITVATICRANAGMEYKGVHTHTRMTIFKQSLSAGNTDTGNFLAIVHALLLLKRNRVELAAIYSGSPQAVRWVREKKCGDIPRSGNKRKKLVEEIDKAEQWLMQNNYKTRIMEWNEDEWGDILEVVFSDSLTKEESFRLN